MTLFQWKYYFSVHEILHRCTAGGRKCNVKSEQPGVWNGSQLEFEVPVGKWISRSVTDALEGHFFMCHTLIPNVTVDFGTEGYFL